MWNASSSNGLPSTGTFSAADYTVFGAMLVISAGIGVFYGIRGRKLDSISEFLLGNRRLKVLPVSMSLLASFVSAIALLGIPADVYQYGTMFFVVNVALLLVMPATAYLYLPVFFGLKLTSVYEYLEKRFNRCLRTMGAIIFTIQMLMYMPLVLYAPSLALAQVTDLNLAMSVLSIGIVCTFYTSIGGIKAVVWTDLLQAILMFVSMFLVVIKGAQDEGGFPVIWQRNYDGNRIEFFNFDMDPTVRHTVWSVVIGGYCIWMGNYAANQLMVQRYLTLPTLLAAQRCLWINLLGLWLMFTLTTLAGMVVYGKYFQCDPLSVKRAGKLDQILPLFVMETLDGLPGLPGLFVSGIFSAALSTVSSGVNSLSTVALEDIIKTHVVKDLSELWAIRITKIVAVSYGLLSIFLVYVASQLGDIMQAGLTVSGIVCGPMLGIYTLGMFFPWANSLGAGLGLLSGFGMSFWIGMGAFVSRPPIPKLPVSINSCPELYWNVTGRTHLPNITTTPDTARKEIFWPYRLSYMWFSAIGFTTVIIVGIIVSFISGHQKPSEVDSKLITPIMRSVYAYFNIDLKGKKKMPTGNPSEEMKTLMLSTAGEQSQDTLAVEFCETKEKSEKDILHWNYNEH